MNVYYQKHCLMDPITPSVMFGGLFTGLSVAQGMPFSPQLAMFNMGGIYLYNTLQCPMVAIQGRESAWHNAASGAILGYVGVMRYNLSVPFVDPMFFYRNPQFPKPFVGAMAYGGMGLAFAMLGNKPF
ncbi:expressed unknown protein [Seminavis robusta]|uniref:Uncharacterized protein n=1 Tax=Seminavis robusta TaxID=568900 RepID=A0A9N8HE84_9STRA|nr:expressed unknown protein [Seminavis robusta]|eukprot:Sro376_g129830.1 n/a (128) ;mRNA; f:58971-59354